MEETVHNPGGGRPLRLLPCFHLSLILRSPIPSPNPISPAERDSTVRDSNHLAFGGCP